MSKPEDSPKKRTFFDSVAEQAKAQKAAPLIHRLHCPNCMETEKIDAKTSQWYYLYRCEVCKNQWSAMVLPQSEPPSLGARINEDGQYVDEEDIEYGDIPGYRDPTRNHDV